MKPKTSRETVSQAKKGRSLVAAMIEHGPKIGRMLVDFLRPDRAEGEAVPDFSGTITAVVQQLRAVILALVLADRRLFLANAEADAARKDRDDKGDTLSRQLGAVKAICNSLINEPVQWMGFDQHATQDHAPLLMESERVLEQLRDSSFESSNYVFPNDDFDPRKYADPLESSTDALREALDKVAATSKAAQAAMLDKRIQKDAFDNLYLHGAQMFECYCRMVGQDALADRIRQSTRTRPSVAEPPTEETQAEETQAEETQAEETQAQGVPSEIPGVPAQDHEASSHA